MKERVSELEEISIETSQIKFEEKKKQKQKQQQKNGISKNWGQLQTVQQMSNGNTRRRTKREMNRINI